VFFVVIFLNLYLNLYLRFAYLPRSGLFGMHGFFDRFECRFNRAGGTITLLFDEEDGRVIGPAQPWVAAPRQ
jgi:hypothetical protein